MDTGLLHLHSFLRWAVVILILVAIVKGAMHYSKGLSKKGFKVALFALIATHLQLIIGLVLFVRSSVVKAAMNPDSALSPRLKTFWTVEHLSTMLLGIALITIGYAMAKRAKTDVKRARLLFWFFLIGFVIIMAGIPWPFREVGLGRGWF